MNPVVNKAPPLNSSEELRLLLLTELFLHLPIDQQNEVIEMIKVLLSHL